MSSSVPVPVFYGLHIQAADLIAAGEAFRQMGPTLHALDLIGRRRRQGTLVTATESGTAVARVPVEVWGLVRLEIHSLGLARARRAVLDTVWCSDCTDRAFMAYEPDLPTETSRKIIDLIYGFSNSVHVATWVEHELDKRRAERLAGGQIWAGDWIDHTHEEPCQSLPAVGKLVKLGEESHVGQLPSSWRIYSR